MKLTDIFKENRPTLSFEVFPPKNTDSFESVKTATEDIAALKPDFMSVTYGAGGGTSEYTTSIAENIQSEYSVPTLAHLTCVSSNKKHLDFMLNRFKENKIENILALRGDIPEGVERQKDWSFEHASTLTEYINSKGDFCVGGACYPEGHPESPNQKQDIYYLKEKCEAGCKFLTTQMFFDNNILYNFLYKVRDAGITVPIIAGIMPVTNAKQITRICKLSGTMLPGRFKQIVDKFGDNPDAMKQAGIAFATEQIIDLLANSVNHIHIYSMNKPDIAKKIKENLSNIL